MKIGILSYNLNSIKDFKLLVKNFPVHDYELFINNQAQNTSKETVEEGICKLTDRQADTIFIMNGSEVLGEIEFNNTSEANVILVKNFTEIEIYLSKENKSEVSVNSYRSRSIILKENTPESDQALEYLLGGTMIRE